jgi:hypothetical protein
LDGPDKVIHMPRRSAILLLSLLLLLPLPVVAGQATRPAAGKPLSSPNLSSTGENVIVGMNLDSIPGFPLCAVVETENTTTGADGATVVVSYKQSVFRDVHGRTRIEQDLNPVGAPLNPQLVTIIIYDPAHKTIVDLFPAAKTAIKTFLNPPETHQQPCSAPILIEPPRLGKQRPSGQPEFHQEELAPDFIDGQKLRHGRETFRIPAHFFGNESASSATTDFWFSRDWQVVVRVKRAGPGKSSHTLNLRDVSRNEPDPTLFLIPEGYKITVSESQDCSTRYKL